MHELNASGPVASPHGLDEAADPVAHQLIDQRRPVLEEVGVAGAERGRRVGRGEATHGVDACRVDTMPTQDGLHAEPWRGRAGV